MSTKTLPMTKERAIEIGGKLWEKGTHSRVYFDMPASLFNVDFGSKNKKFKANLVKMYFDCTDSKLKCDATKYTDELAQAALKLLKA